VAWVDITEDEDETETGGATSETQTVTSGEENDGVTTLTATATATAGWSGSLAENSTLSTFYCNEDEVWQYVDQVGGESYVSHSYPQNFRLIYCDTDDLTVTNTKLWQQAIDKKAANAILIKLNQAGTVTETVDCCLLAKKYNLDTIPSHRGGGETNDTFLVDLAVAMGSKWIKVGPTRGERVCKYNRLMRIEEELKLT
jgi:enolase